MLLESLKSADDVARLHVDTKRKVDTTSVYGQLYFLTIIDEYSCYTMTNTLKRIGGTFEFLLNFIISFEKEYECTGKKVNGDICSEFFRQFDNTTKKGLQIPKSDYTPK